MNAILIFTEKTSQRCRSSKFLVLNFSLFQNLFNRKIIARGCLSKTNSCLILYTYVTQFFFYHYDYIFSSIFVLLFSVIYHFYSIIIVLRNYPNFFSVYRILSYLFRLSDSLNLHFLSIFFLLDLRPVLSHICKSVFT